MQHTTQGTDVCVMVWQKFGQTNIYWCRSWHIVTDIHDKGYGLILCE
jgi:hypothetical protein